MKKDSRLTTYILIVLIAGIVVGIFLNRCSVGPMPLWLHPAGTLLRKKRITESLHSIRELILPAFIIPGSKAIYAIFAILFVPLSAGIAILPDNGRNAGTLIT